MDVIDEKMDGFLMRGFNKSDADPNLYYHIDGNEGMILVLYVDDLFPMQIGQGVQ
jgi:hypothetical protein